MKRIITLVALISAIAFPVNAQNDLEELQKEVIKRVEDLIKEADKNPKNGKKQIVAAEALCWDDLGDKLDYDRALIYANRALKIAETQPVLKDTLMGSTCSALGYIYQKKQNLENALDYYEKALNAYEQELGRYDPVTIYHKLQTGYMIMLTFDARRGSLFIQQAFLDSERAPAEKRLKNLENISAVYELAIDFLTADITLRMQRGLPLITFEGKKYFILETPEWNMEQPIVGWLVPQIMRPSLQKEEKPDGDIILLDDEDPNADLRVIKPDDPERPNFEVSFSLDATDRQTIIMDDSNARILFFQEPLFNQILTKYREFKNTHK